MAGDVVMELLAACAVAAVMVAAVYAIASSIAGGLR